MWWVKNILSWTLLAAAVALLAALVVVPRLTGSTAYTVLTGSMEPTYPPGTLIVVKPTAGDQLEAGDVITFQPESGNPSVTTHRIVSIVYDASGVRRFITKGDANNTADAVQLVEEQIRGRLWYSVPYVGRINSLISGSSRSILVVLIAGGLGAYALWMWYSSYRDRGKDTPEPDEASPDQGSPKAGPPPGSGPLVGPPRPPGEHAPTASRAPYQPGPHSHEFAQPAGSSPPATTRLTSQCVTCGSPTEPSSAITQPIPVIQ
ncbi:signal peptidase I [Gordonia phosphorivorans]|uniref:Signal peptidase I n=2 Tax=Gordonia phosphorivorans TaxID=1056982 RepID=A0ABV6HBU0_9ACTN